MSKKAGRHSQGANDFLAPYAPTIGTATNVGTGRAYNNGAATVTFTADPRNDATSYTVTASTGQTATGSSSPITVTGIASTATPTFTVTAINSYGTSDASSASNQITVTTVPDAPSAPTVSSPTPSAGVNVAGASYDVVNWSAPANGGASVTGYRLYDNGSLVGDVGNVNSYQLNEGGGSNHYFSVLAYNSNGDGAQSANSATVTTFSFSPFSVFGFSPFSVFGFSPFSVFGFSPFGVFGFSPFGVFGFSPFSVFGFSPFSVFGFAPFSVFAFFSVFGFSPTASQRYTCIDEDTPIAVPGPNDTIIYKTAKDITVGEEIYSAVWDQLIDESFGTPYDSPVANITGVTMNKTTVVALQPSVKAATVYFNDDQTCRFSFEEQILIKKNDMWEFSHAITVEVGDILLKKNEDHTFSEMQVTKVTTINEDRTVYTFDCEPTDTLIAGNIVVHNAKAF
jgi:hypothetical protein